MRVIAESLVSCWNGEAVSKLSTIAIAASRLPQSVAILDAEGCIVYVNPAWTRFALTNGLKNPAICGPGASYLDVCHKAAAEGDSSARKIELRMQQVLAGTSQGFSHEYACNSPLEERWFVMEVRRLSTSGFSGALVLHERVWHTGQVATGQSPESDLQLACPRCGRVQTPGGVWQTSGPLLEPNSRPRFSMRFCPDCIKCVYLPTQ